MSEILSSATLRQKVDEWLAAGTLVAGPARIKAGRVLYLPLASSQQLLLDGFVHPANSIKEFVFPKHEALYGYRLAGKHIDLVDLEAPKGGQVIIGARPCDAASLPILDHIFSWDFPDEFYRRRRQSTVVVTLACATYDDACFCSSLGLGPAAERGSDILLLPLGENEYEVRCLTAQGRGLFEGSLQPSQRIATPAPGPPVRFDAGRVQKHLQDQFQSDLWNRQSLACLGCGACAYTCPTCHCFDIADEGNAAGGIRARNWDSCQFPLFTLHASGHNPRPVQASRLRQRIYHKFQIYPEKFGELLCTGCGNCSRNCPVGSGVLGVLSEMEHGQHL